MSGGHRLLSGVVASRGPTTSVADLPFMFAERHREVAARAIEACRWLLDRGLTHGDDGHRAVARAFGERGLFTEIAPQGRPVDLRALCIIREALGWTDAAADSLFAVQGLGTHPIHAFGTDDQRARWLAPALDGREIAAFALTEPEVGTDVASLRTVGRKVEGGYRLDGEKVFISNAPVADRFVVFANVDPTAGRKGITAFLVARGDAGLETAADLPLLAEHSIGTVRLRDCFVGDDRVLGGVGAGFRIAMATLDTFRVSVGGAAVGMARRAIDEAQHRMLSRRQFGAPIGDQQQLQAYLADSICELDAARLLVLRAARLRDEGAASITQEAAIAKLFATEAAQRIIDRAVQIHGGAGVLSGAAVERLYRDVRALRIYEGTSEIQRVVIAKARLDAERARS